MIDKEDIEWLISLIVTIFLDWKNSQKKEKPSKRPRPTKKRKRK